jgi:uncharacterized protein (DUF362 family)
MATKSTVSIIKADEKGIEAAVRKAADVAGGWQAIVTPNSKVLIKPNLCQPEPSGVGLVTDCRLTEAVTKMVLESGPESVIIGDGAGAGYDFSGSVSTDEAFILSGTSAVAHRYGVELRNLNRDAFEEVSIGRPYVMKKVKIARTVLESDVIINLPIMKTHIRTLVTLSLKNMKGVMPGVEKRKTHRLGLDKAIADLNSVVKSNYVFVDALAAMQGLWEYPHDRVEMGLILAGADPVAVDTVGTCLMGFDPAQVMHLQYFAARQGRKAVLSEVNVVGESINENRLNFKSSYEVLKSRYGGIRVIEGKDACSGCYGELMGALMAVRQFSNVDALNELVFIIGSPEIKEDTVQDKTVVFGKCASKLAHLGSFAKGCPTMGDDMIRVICRTAGIDADSIISSRNRNRDQKWGDTRHLLKK